MEDTKQKPTIILTIIISVVFGLSAGVIGDMAIWSYFLNDNYTMPFVGDLNLSETRYGGSNIVIRDAKNVVVEQDDKAIETIKSVSDSIVGIFVRAQTTENQNDFDLKNYYYIDNEVSQGLIVTNDGWILTGYNGLNYLNISNYVVITKNREIYEIEKIIHDKKSNFNFLRLLGAKDLPIKQFAEEGELQEGETILTLNWGGYGSINSIIKIKDNGKVVRSSDVVSRELILNNQLDENLKNSFIFDFDGKIVGVIDSKKIAYPISNIKRSITSLLDDGDISRPMLGINYINLSKITNEEIASQEGALIYKNNIGVSVIKNSPANLAGLIEGDILTHIDGEKINKDNDLAVILQNYKPESTINISYLRKGEELNTEVRLSTLK